MEVLQLGDNIQRHKCGAKQKDLTAELGALVWPSAPAKLIVTNTDRLFWKLPCQLHLRYMSIQAAKRQLENSKHPGALSPCERCSVGNYRSCPEPQADLHRSYFELMTWLAVEHALCTPAVDHYITTNATQPMNMMVGRELGYVVEPRLVQKWNGSVDVWVPGLHLIIQVDGQHHDEDHQQDKDVSFMVMAVQQGFNVFRMHYQDIKYVHAEVAAIAHACMLREPGCVVARCSRSHVLLQHKQYMALIKA
jgi:very-short-patch-repair endonuclease